MKEQEVVASNPLTEAKIASKIMVIRDIQVLLDRDIAEMYGVETKVFNQAVKRNIKRFPDAFRFQLNEDEALEVERSSRSQFVTLNNSGNLRGSNIKYLPYAFTEQGVAMLLKPRLKQFNQQYPTATMDYTQKMHDRFLIVDNKDLYHIGASLKDLGKQCFAFDKMEDSKTIIPAILTNLS